MTIDKESILFLLGGYDLEMATIREVLLEEGLEEGKHFFDKKLSWGAKLSSYRDILEKYPEKTLYGIELTEDIELPKNYRRIDHHNDYAERDASLLPMMSAIKMPCAVWVLQKRKRNIYGKKTVLRRVSQDKWS